jgi:hypothetical protein
VGNALAAAQRTGPSLAMVIRLDAVNKSRFDEDWALAGPAL